MAYEQTDIYVLAERTGAPEVGVLVRVYDKAGKTLFTESVTGDDGRAGFLLFSQEYSLRFYKFGVGFTQPQFIEVLSNPAIPGKTANAFNVSAAVLEPPLALDPRLCRASGYFRDVTGAPRPQLDIHFIGQFSPILLEGSLVMDERRQLKTDKQGFACIDLIRCANYLVTLEAYEDRPRTIRVPDAPSVNLPDLLFPVVDRVVLPAISLAVNEEQQLQPQVIDSAGVPLPSPAGSDVTWTAEDPSVLYVAASTDYLLVKGLKVGSTTLTATRRDSTIIRVPDTDIAGVPVSVTVA